VVPTELEKEYKQVLDVNDTANIIKICTKTLEYDFTDINSHIMIAYCLRLLGDSIKADHHSTISSRLIQSIDRSGDGKTKASAFHVFQVKEEYNFLKAVGLKMINQSLIRDESKSFDLLECQAPNGETISLYFDITEHMVNLSDKNK